MNFYLVPRIRTSQQRHLQYKPHWQRSKVPTYSASLSQNHVSSCNRLVNVDASAQKGGCFAKPRYWLFSTNGLGYVPIVFLSRTSCNLKGLLFSLGQR